MKPGCKLADRLSLLGNSMVTPAAIAYPTTPCIAMAHWSNMLITSTEPIAAGVSGHLLRAARGMGPSLTFIEKDALVRSQQQVSFIE